MTVVRVATRPSRLARIQAGLAIERIKRFVPDADWEIVPVHSEGDNRPDEPLHSFGDKAVFITAVEAALVDGRADLAVHSLKVLPLDTPRGLWLPMFLPREDPRDALISRTGAGLGDLRAGAAAGTSSARRAGQLRLVRPDLEFREIRGNVETRIRKLREGEFDAIILAAAGLQRLGLAGEVTEMLDPDTCLPAPGQGVIAVECRENYELGEELRAASDGQAELAARCERRVAALVGATCVTPFAALATAGEDMIQVRAWLESESGPRSAEATGAAADWAATAERVAAQLI